MELVVVMAIIGILAALTVPALIKARKRSRQSSCMVNLKNIGRAAEGFAEDNDGYYPWQTGFVGYLSNPYGSWLSDGHYAMAEDQIYPPTLRSRGIRRRGAFGTFKDSFDVAPGNQAQQYIPDFVGEYSSWVLYTNILSSPGELICPQRQDASSR